MDLLAQCQEGAVQLGNLIEKTEGEEAATIPLLESYCELAYRIYEEINGGVDETINENKIYKKLRKALLQIENSIRNDIKVRLEVVFFPYKASMWDSLESIWKAVDEDENTDAYVIPMWDSLESVWMAANGDPDCDAYVVPIPYYDRNRDGALGVYHYEGGSLPEYVPIVYYENYSLEERRPDIAYIHNPYDQGNYVTTVDPRFYSAELKKYIDKLVYIPYYTTTGGMAEAGRNGRRTGAMYGLLLCGLHCHPVGKVSEIFRSGFAGQ